MLSYEEFLENLSEINARIAQACKKANRDISSVRLLPVTKNHPWQVVEYSKRAGFEYVGENRVQEALSKMPNVDIKWELIGHLQSNKAPQAVANFDVIESVDSEKLLVKIDAKAKELGKVQKVLIQVNTAQDDAKFGLDDAHAKSIVKKALELENIQLNGLMTIGFLDENLEVARLCFSKLRQLKEALQAEFNIELKELSMGMSGDLEQAIEEGSTIIRVGTALFGERHYE
ncbi:MAG: YggS family pyridoxal phosphate-dependent enzyme [Opitutales bacterium]